MKTERRTCPTCGQRKPAAAFGDSTSCRVCVATGRPGSRAQEREAVRGMHRAFVRLHIGELIERKRGAA
jgi:hypothetical protein